MINNYIITWQDNQGKFRVSEIESDCENNAIKKIQSQSDFNSVITWIQFNRQ